MTIHSTYGDTHRMMTLSRGIEPCWINDKDAARIGLVDNDWVEVYNDNGSWSPARRVARVQRGLHDLPRSGADATIPRVPVRGNRRGGAQPLRSGPDQPFRLAGGTRSYVFNYWGPIRVFTRDTYAVVKKKLERLV
jgi:nitrate reductase alpha subunit